jgi:alpha-glucosidase
MLGLPGSAYVYQGEELGLPEVADIPADERQDPSFFRNPGVDIGRDGCRVPLPWAREGSSFGFGPGDAHLPQPSWFGEYSVEAEDADPTSTLALYRAALAARRDLQTDETLEWLPVDGRDDVLHFVRPGGWHVVCVFGTEPVDLAALGLGGATSGGAASGGAASGGAASGGAASGGAEVLVASGPLSDAGQLPGETAAWLRA